MESARHDVPSPPPGFPLEAIRHRWGLLVGFGSLLLVLGVFALIANAIGTLTSVYLFGFVVLAGGVTQLILGFTAQGWKGVVSHLMIGIFAVVTGLLMIRAPLMGASALTLLLATWLLVSGASQIAHALLDRFPQWRFSLAAGIAGALLGVLVLVQWPISSLWFVGLYVGITFLFYGASWIGLGLAARRGIARPRGRGPGPMRPQPAT